jgi:hypothetical protein
MTESNPTFSVNLKCSRSPPIPKEVNMFVLTNFGAAYYHATDFQTRQDLLRTIGNVLEQAGYTITTGEIERRLKNMKSHYRRKRADMEQGTHRKVEWQYFDILSKIFATSNDNEMKTEDSPRNEEVTEVTTTPDHVEHVDESSSDNLNEEEPQDLRIKKPRIDNETQSIQLPMLNDLDNLIGNPLQAGKESYVRIVEGLRAINIHRSILTNQIQELEAKRQDLDNLGLQLTNLLILFQNIENLNISSQSNENTSSN